MEDNQAVRKVIKARGSMKLMHLPRAHRIGAAAISEQLTRGIVTFQCERTQIEAAGFGATLFADPTAWVM
eukprot:9472306-Pyramimonas_sp.AAC.1